MIILRQKEYMLYDYTRDANGKLVRGNMIADGSGVGLDKQVSATGQQIGNGFGVGVNKLKGKNEAVGNITKWNANAVKNNLASTTQTAQQNAITQARADAKVNNAYAKGVNQGYNNGYKTGQNSVTGWNGAKTWASNTWNNMGTGGKIATGAAGAAAAIGLGSLIANNIRNKRRAEEAEEDLREERRRRRR